jgi:hypothetical protein
MFLQMFLQMFVVCYTVCFVFDGDACSSLHVEWGGTALKVDTQNSQEPWSHLMVAL